MAAPEELDQEKVGVISTNTAEPAPTPCLTRNRFIGAALLMFIVTGIVVALLLILTSCEDNMAGHSHEDDQCAYSCGEHGTSTVSVTSAANSHEQRGDEVTVCTCDADYFGLDCTFACIGCTWHLGFYGDTCSAVCSAVGRTCADGDWGVHSLASFEVALKAAGESPDVMCPADNWYGFVVNSESLTEYYESLAPYVREHVEHVQYVQSGVSGQCGYTMTETPSPQGAHLVTSSCAATTRGTRTRIDPVRRLCLCG